MFDSHIKNNLQERHVLDQKLSSLLKAFQSRFDFFHPPTNHSKPLNWQYKYEQNEYYRRLNTLTTFLKDWHFTTPQYLDEQIITQWRRRLIYLIPSLSEINKDELEKEIHQQFRWFDKKIIKTKILEGE